MGTQPPESDSHTLVFESETDNPEQLLQYILQSVELSDITRVRMELDASAAIRLDGETDAVVQTESSDTGSGPEDAPAAQQESEADQQAQQEEQEEQEDEGVVRFHESSAAYTVAKTLYERNDQFLLIDQIQQFTSDTSGIPDGRFSNILWDLADRGLVEKRQSSEDGRKKEYKLTSKGIQSIEQMDGQ